MTGQTSVKKSVAEIKRFLLSNGVILIALFLIIGLTIAEPNFLSFLNVMNVLRQISIVGIMACAVTLLMITGNLDLSIGSLLTLTSFVAASLTPISVPLAIVLPIIVGGLFGAINGFLIGTLKLNSFIITLAMMNIIQIIALVYSGSRYMTPEDAGIFRQIGQGVIFGIPVPVLIMIVVAVIFHYLLTSSVFGRQIVAVGGNPICAAYSGVKTQKTIFMSFLLVGLTVGLAGVVFCSRLMSAQTTGGSGKEFEVVTAVVLGGLSLQGGKGNVLYSLLGAVVVGIILNGFVLLSIPINYQYLAQGLILIIAVALDSRKVKRR